MLINNNNNGIIKIIVKPKKAMHPYTRNPLTTHTSFYTTRNVNSKYQPLTPSHTYHRAPRKILSKTNLKERPCALTDISAEYSSIKAALNEPTSQFQKSRTHAMKYKNIEYRKLFKNWCEYHEHAKVQQNLTLFHDYFTNLRNNVYPFTLLKDKGDEKPVTSEVKTTKAESRTRPLIKMNSQVVKQETGTRKGKYYYIHKLKMRARPRPNNALL